jgi:hypothetical protein
MSDDELIDHLRRAAATWFKNSDLLLLEELIRRYRKAGSKLLMLEEIVEDRCHAETSEILPR